MRGTRRPVREAFSVINTSRHPHQVGAQFSCPSEASLSKTRFWKYQLHTKRRGDQAISPACFQDQEGRKDLLHLPSTELQPAAGTSSTTRGNDSAAGWGAQTF
eukprot:1138223-Pelagomonas_calceolata.AAC.8